jgi:hypothetical protein
VSRSVGGFFTEDDLLITPTLGKLPRRYGALEQDDPDHTTRSWLESLFEYGPFTVVFNIPDQPAISLPLAQSAGGLPIGVQLVAPYAAKTRCSRSRPSSSRPCPGGTEPRPPTSAARTPTVLDLRLAPAGALRAGIR